MIKRITQLFYRLFNNIACLLATLWIIKIEDTLKYLCSTGK